VAAVVGLVAVPLLQGRPFLLRARPTARVKKERLLISCCCVLPVLGAVLVVPLPLPRHVPTGDHGPRGHPHLCRRARDAARAERQAGTTSQGRARVSPCSAIWTLIANRPAESSAEPSRLRNWTNWRGSGSPDSAGAGSNPPSARSPQSTENSSPGVWPITAAICSRPATACVLPPPSVPQRKRARPITTLDLASRS